MDGAEEKYEIIRKRINSVFHLCNWNFKKLCQLCPDFGLQTSYRKNVKQGFLIHLERNTELFTTGHTPQENFLVLQALFWVWAKYKMIMFFPDLLECLLVLTDNFPVVFLLRFPK